jgi:transcriptional antiterminator RfaH
MASLFPFDPDEFNWFVLFVRTNQEKTTAARLGAAGIEYFLPTFPSLRQWKDRRVTLELPLFPSYVFVRLPYRERLRALTVSSVLYMVGPGHSPAVLTEEELAWIRQGVNSGKAVPHEYLHEGQRVIITSGALSGLQGILVRQVNQARLVVSLDSIGRGFAVEVDLESVSRCEETNISALPQRFPVQSAFHNAEASQRSVHLRRT